jgi:hypothetical protein
LKVKTKTVAASRKRSGCSDSALLNPREPKDLAQLQTWIAVEAAGVVYLFCVINQQAICEIPTFVFVGDQMFPMAKTNCMVEAE